MLCLNKTYLVVIKQLLGSDALVSVFSNKLIQFGYNWIKMEILKVLVIVYSFSNCAFSYPFFNGDIRLIGGAHIYEGTVLVFHDNKWGSICDYHWDIRDAHVVCRQLGYPRALQHVHGSTFGRGRRKLYLFTNLSYVSYFFLHISYVYLFKFLFNCFVL